MPKGKYPHRKWTKEEKEKRSILMMGENNFFFGKHHSTKAKKIISKSHIGHPSLKMPKTEITKQKMRLTALKRYENPENNPRWKGGNSRSYGTNQARKVCNYTQCKLCSRNDSLILHHRDGNRKNNLESNIVCLCGSCHIWLHKNKIAWEW